MRFFKDALVFIFLAFLLESEYDATLGQVIRTHLEPHLVARQNLDVVHPHLAGDVSRNLMTVLQFYAEHGVGERFEDLAILLNS